MAVGAPRRNGTNATVILVTLGDAPAAPGETHSTNAAIRVLARHIMAKLSSPQTMGGLDPWPDIEHPASAVEKPKRLG
jgi:hypothetical protein